MEEILPGYLGRRDQHWDKAARRIEITTDFFQDQAPELGYDSLESIKQRQITLDEEKYTVDYDYNALGQLTSEKGEIEHHYSYDSIGNRLQRDNSTYKVNDLNQVTEAENTFYTYDPSGNLATKTVGSRTWIYQSNPLNQIISIKDPDQNVTTFTYDLSGKCLSKRVECKGKKTSIYRFFYLGDTEIGCVDEKGAITELKVPSNPNNPESPCIAIEIKKETYVPLYDLQGNIVCLLDHTKRIIVETYRYSVYGEEEIINERGKAVSDSMVGNLWRYRSKRVDQETGLIYFGYRYYDPEIGRWISPDPLGTIDGSNLYAFVRNNPIKYIDYFGLSSATAENCGCVLHDHPGWQNAPPDCVCICGRDGATEVIPGSYRSKRGSDIQDIIYSLGPVFATADTNDIFEIRSAPYQVGSKDLANGGIGFINGINNSQDEAKGNALRLSQYAGGIKIHGIYNASHSLPVDFVKCILGYLGIKSAPVQLLKNQWNHFIATYGPNAKFLQICHSGGAIDVFNALLTSPKAVRDRIIVLAISPGAVVPRKLCFRSYNYASKRDLISAFDVVGNVQYGDQLTLLDPHKDALFHDHGIDSPTFKKKLNELITDYIRQYGEQR